MIRVEMHGRLGNQFFQYAAARCLQEKNKQNIILSFRQVTGANTEGTSGWENSLKYFNVEAVDIYDGNNSLLFEGMPVVSKIIGLVYAIMYKPFMNNFYYWYKFQRLWCPLLDKFGLRWIANGYYSFTYDNKKEILLNGSFESSSYFNEIREILLDEFTPIEPPLDKNKELYKTINNSNSVCLSIRHFQLEGKQAERYNVCTKKYYYSAIKKIKELVDDPTFIIFSDDIDWVKKEFDFGNSQYCFETDDNPIWEKIRLMYSCKHFIISNSTFSWWAQYLGRETGKIVIGPTKWFNDRFESPLIEKSWIKINSEGNIV